jgi:hypothetical protein
MSLNLILHTNISGYCCFIKIYTATIYVNNENVLISKTGMLKNSVTFSSMF